MTLCLYAVVTPPARRMRMTGARGEALRVVRAKGVAGIVGEQASALEPTTRNLRAYHGVIESLALQLPALLPARFGTMLDEEELVLVLSTRARFFGRALARVRRRAQMTVRVVRENDSTAASRGHEERVADRSSGVAYLRSRAVEAGRAAASRECVAIRRRVRRWIRAERVDDRDQVLTVYHLVPRMGAEPYRRAVMDVSNELMMRVQVSGPFAPFAFADAFEAQASAAGRQPHRRPREPVRHG